MKFFKYCCFLALPFLLTACGDPYGIEGKRYKLVASNSFNNAATTVFITFTNVGDEQINTQVELHKKKYRQTEPEITHLQFESYGLFKKTAKFDPGLFVISSSKTTRNKSIDALAIERPGGTPPASATLMIKVSPNSQIQSKHKELADIARKFKVNIEDILIGSGPIAVGLKSRTYSSSLGCSGYGRKTCFLIPAGE